MLQKQLVERLDRLWAAQQIALGIATALLMEKIQMALLLNALGNHR